MKRPSSDFNLVKGSGMMLVLLKSARVTSVDRINEVGTERSEESAFELEAQTLTVNPRDNSEKINLSL